MGDYPRAEAYRDWFTDAEYDHLVGRVIDWLERHDFILLQVETHCIIAQSPTEARRVVDLDFMIRTARRTSIGNWQSLVDTHLDALEHGTEVTRIALEDADVLSDYLTVRVAHGSAFGWSAVQHWLARPLCGQELVQFLALDFPLSFHAIKRAEFPALQIPESELFSIALENFRRRSLELGRYFEHPQPADQIIYELAHADFGASYLLTLELVLPEALTAAGAIVAAPSRERVLVYPLRDFVHLNVLRELRARTDAAFATEPDPLSDQLFWYQAGTFVALAGRGVEPADLPPPLRRGLPNISRSRLSRLRDWTALWRKP